MKQSSARHDHELTDDGFDALVRDSAAILDRLSDGPAGMFPALVLADPHGARQLLRDERERRRSFLELGSGFGVITIIADLLGYDAYGIEIEPRLEEESRRLAQRHGSTATFIGGSFVPPDFQEEVELLDAGFHTITAGADAYEEMGMVIGDFDLVYAYTWPDETEWMHALFRRYAGPNAALMSYSVRDGFELTGRAE